MADTADIVIAGAGVIGMSAAFQIARRSNARIIVVDKGMGPGEGSTGASSAVCRFKYSRSEMVELARDGIAAYQHWPDFLGEARPLANYRRIGALWLANGSDDGAARDSERLRSVGVRTVVLDDEALGERFPALNPCVIPPNLVTGEPHDCQGGGRHLLELDAGYIDPVDTLQDLIAAARRAGVEVRFGIELSGIHSKGGAVSGVSLDTGARIDCGVLINAAGPWCESIYRLAGVDCRWPLKATRIQVVQIDLTHEIVGDLPACADAAGGIYFRPQGKGQQLILGSVLEQDEQEVVDADSYAGYADDEFIRAKLHALEHRIPASSDRRRIHGYAGLYTMNQTDVHPVVGRTQLQGFYVANGFSGHGFKIAPAIGSLLAREITAEARTFDTMVDPEFLAFDRKPILISSKSVLA